MPRPRRPGRVRREGGQIMSPTALATSITPTLRRRRGLTRGSCRRRDRPSLPTPAATDHPGTGRRGPRRGEQGAADGAPTPGSTAPRPERPDESQRTVPHAIPSPTPPVFENLRPRASGGGGRSRPFAGVRIRSLVRGRGWCAAGVEPAFPLALDGGGLGCLLQVIEPGHERRASSDCMLVMSASTGWPANDSFVVTRAPSGVS